MHKTVSEDKPSASAKNVSAKPEEPDKRSRRERLKRMFSKGNFLGTVERTLGIWYPGPNDEPDDTNPQIQAAFQAYVEKRLGQAYSCAPRDVTEPGTPNLVILNQRTQKCVEAVTCYRSQMFIGDDGEAYLPWTTQETYDKLAAFAKSEEKEVFVIIGLHGFADAPKFLFSVPLSEAVIDLKKSVLSSHEIQEESPFVF